MTILDASVEVLRASDKPLTSKEILQVVQDRNLYTFGAKDPLKVLSGTIRKEAGKGDAARIVEVERGRFRLPQ